MNRHEWLKEKRRLAENRYDQIFSIDYDEKWGNISSIHKMNLIYFLNSLPKDVTVLDAACGTGKYWQIIIDAGYRVLGIDQSRQMLNKAVSKYKNVETNKLGLQEINFNDEFYGVVCIDAMENVFPEEWILVLKNFYNALKIDGFLYFTVELADNDEIIEAYENGIRMDLPIIKGEVAHKGGYHYHPQIHEVKEWVIKSGFIIYKEDISDGYYHFIVKKANKNI